MTLKLVLRAVYDLTIAYVPRPPTFVDNLFGLDPAEVHIDVRRILPAAIPCKEGEASAWLYGVFKRKDEMVSTRVSTQIKATSKAKSKTSRPPFCPEWSKMLRRLHFRCHHLL